MKKFELHATIEDNINLLMVAMDGCCFPMPRPIELPIHPRHDPV